MADSNVRTRNQLDALPVHPTPDIDPHGHLLRVSGVVESPAAYSAADLLECPRAEVVEDFGCEEGWEVPMQRWAGVRLGSLLDRSHPGPDAAWVTLGAGDFSIALPVAEARKAIVALSLNGEALPVVHGGPMRLIVPGDRCYTSIKWLDRIELTAETASTTARTIALRRIGRDSDG